MIDEDDRARSSGNPDIPAHNDPRYPRLPSGQPDHVAAVKLFDPEGSALFEVLYKDFEWAHPTAKLYIRKRRNGELSLKRLQLIHGWRTEHWQEWDPTEYTWPGNAHALLQSVALIAAVTKAKSCARGELESLHRQGIAGKVDDETYLSFIHQALDQLERHKLTSFTEALDSYAFRGEVLWPMCVALLCNKSETPETLAPFLAEHRERMLKELGAHPCLYAFLKGKKAPPELATGVSEADYDAAVEAHQRPGRAKQARLNALLK